MLSDAVLIILIMILMLYLIYYSEENITESPKNIMDKGFMYYQCNENLENLNVIQKQNIIKEKILSHLPMDFVFLDYYYYIKGCSLSTFHRDVTSGQKYLNTKYPTYTVILYEYNGDFLSLCPNSHQQFPFIYSKPVNISGDTNTIVIFNSDILHAGMINNIGINRKVLQFKVAHKDDLHVFKELNNVKLEKTTDCSINRQIEHILRFLSLHFSWLINGISYPLLQKKYDNNYIQEIIPVSFYNNIN
jgi:hypothetical protein